MKKILILILIGLLFTNIYSIKISKDNVEENLLVIRIGFENQPYNNVLWVKDLEKDYPQIKSIITLKQVLWFIYFIILSFYFIRIMTPDRGS